MRLHSVAFKKYLIKNFNILVKMGKKKSTDIIRTKIIKGATV